MKLLRTLPWILLATLGACSTPSAKIDRLYTSLQADSAERGRGALPDPKLEERNTSRAASVREILADGDVEDRKARLQAAVLLVETNDLDDLALAEKIGRQVGLDGEKLGFRVAAEAIDKQLMLHHQPQHYGTQYEWVVVLQEWRLYPLDPATTDSDRRAMEVPPLVELYEGEKKLNAGVKRK